MRPAVKRREFKVCVDVCGLNLDRTTQQLRSAFHMSPEQFDLAAKKEPLGMIGRAVQHPGDESLRLRHVAFFEKLSRALNLIGGQIRRGRHGCAHDAPRDACGTCARNATSSRSPTAASTVLQSLRRLCRISETDAYQGIDDPSSM